MAHDKPQVLLLVKIRLNRLPEDTSLDDYLTARIEAADEELESTGILLEAGSIEDTIFLTDFVVWQYSARDSGDAMPKWLQKRRTERWLQQLHRGDGG